MCGRFTLAIDVGDLFEEGPVQLPADLMEDYKPRFNIAPTQLVLTAGAQGPGSGEYMRWGLVPVWSKDAKGGFKMINARAETLRTSGAFKRPFQRQRCLILADGFFEWRTEGASKTAMRIVLKDRRVFAFAGLWDEWTNPETKERMRSCTIVTCEPNDFMATIHDRMPVIVPESAYDHWLDRDEHDVARLTSLLGSYPAEEMEAYKVKVGSSKEDRPEFIVPIP